VVTLKTYSYNFMCVYSNMPDSVLESQLSDADNHGNVLSSYDALTKRSAVFVDLYDAARYGTRSILLFVYIFFIKVCLTDDNASSRLIF